MKKKKLKKQLAELRRFIPVFKNGLLGVDFEIEHELEPGTSRMIVGPCGNPFVLTLTFEDRTEQYSGLVKDMDRTPR